MDPDFNETHHAYTSYIFKHPSNLNPTLATMFSSLASYVAICSKTDGRKLHQFNVVPAHATEGFDIRKAKAINHFGY